MSRERELLERAKYAAFKAGALALAEEIRAYLADTNPSETINSQEVDRSEPVAWTCQDELNALGTDVTCYMYAEPLVGETNIPLYPRPAPQRSFVRLSEEEMALLVLHDDAWQTAERIQDALEEKNK